MNQLVQKIGAFIRIHRGQQAPRSSASGGGKMFGVVREMFGRGDIHKRSLAQAGDDPQRLFQQVKGCENIGNDQVSSQQRFYGCPFDR